MTPPVKITPAASPESRKKAVTNVGEGYLRELLGGGVLAAGGGGGAEDTHIMDSLSVNYENPPEFQVPDALMRETFPGRADRRIDPNRLMWEIFGPKGGKAKSYYDNECNQGIDAHKGEFKIPGSMSDVLSGVYFTKKILANGYDLMRYLQAHDVVTGVQSMAPAGVFYAMITAAFTKEKWSRNYKSYDGLKFPYIPRSESVMEILSTKKLLDEYDKMRNSKKKVEPLEGQNLLSLSSQVDQCYKHETFMSFYSGQGHASPNFSVVTKDYDAISPAIVSLNIMSGLDYLALTEGSEREVAQILDTDATSETSYAIILDEENKDPERVKKIREERRAKKDAERKENELKKAQADADEHKRIYSKKSFLQRRSLKKSVSIDASGNTMKKSVTSINALPEVVTEESIGKSSFFQRAATFKLTDVANVVGKTDAEVTSMLDKLKKDLIRIYDNDLKQASIKLDAQLFEEKIGRPRRINSDGKKDDAGNPLLVEKCGDSEKPKLCELDNIDNIPTSRNTMVVVGIYGKNPGETVESDDDNIRDLDHSVYISRAFGKRSGVEDAVKKEYGLPRDKPIGGTHLRAAIQSLNQLGLNMGEYGNNRFSGLFKRNRGMSSELQLRVRPWSVSEITKDGHPNGAVVPLVAFRLLRPELLKLQNSVYDKVEKRIFEFISELKGKKHVVPRPAKYTVTSGQVIPEPDPGLSAADNEASKDGDSSCSR